MAAVLDRVRATIAGCFPNPTRLGLALGLAAFALAGLAGLGHASAGSKFTTLYRFQGSNHGDGVEPWASMVRDKAGVLYGTTILGGSSTACGTSSTGTAGCGTVFRLAPPLKGSKAWREEVIHSFDAGADGAFPYGGLIRDGKGLFYGTTSQGGPPNGFCSFGCGTVFMLTPPAAPNGAWSESIPYAFEGGTDGSAPLSGLVFDSAGRLIGSTEEGGAGPQCGGQGCGTVFNLALVNSVWTVTILYNFQNPGDGIFATTTPAIDQNGAIYGVTDEGGAYQSGIFFQLTKQGGSYQETGKYDFPGYLWSSFPEFGTIIRLNSGAIVGVTPDGGDPDCGFCGTVYMMVPPAQPNGAWVYEPIHRFHGGGDGARPIAGLVMDAKGALFGTTTLGGNNGNCVQFLDGGPTTGGCGTVFKLTPPPKGKTRWTESVLHRFSGGLGGGDPIGGLVIDGKGVLYGTTAAGGLGCATGNGCGTVFMLKP